MSFNDTVGMYGGPTQEDFRAKLQAAESRLNSIAGAKQVQNIGGGQLSPMPLQDYGTEIRNLKHEVERLGSTLGKFAEEVCNRLASLELKVGS